MPSVSRVIATVVWGVACAAVAPRAVLAQASTPPAVSPGPAPAGVVVRPLRGDAVVLDSAALARLPRRTLRATEHGRSGVFTGVPLAAVLAAAGVRVDSLRGPTLADVLVAEAADGYRVTFALGELAPDLGARDVLIADTRDGRRLDAHEGPYRLVVPADGRPARGVRQLRTLSVWRPTAPTADPSRPPAR